jgi:hypothetical protein
MMKRLVTYLFFFGLFAIALALLLPSLINWNEHKDSVAARIEEYVGREVDIGGNVRFTLLPNPQVLLEDVSILNPAGAKNEKMVSLRMLEAKVRFKPLLEGKFEVETVNLVEPQLNLEILPGGKANWTGFFKDRPDIGPSASAVMLNHLGVTRGTLRYANAVTGAGWEVPDLNLNISADTLLGPYRITGDMIYNGAPVNIEIGTGKYDKAAPFPLRATFNPVEKLPQVLFSGALEVKSADDIRALQGELSLENGPIAALFRGGDLKNVSFLNDVAEASAIFRLEGNKASLSDIKADFSNKGSLSGIVNVQFPSGEKPYVSAELKGTKIVLSNGGFMPAPASFIGRFNFEGENVKWGDRDIPRVSGGLETDGKEWVVKDGKLSFAGNSVLTLSGLVTPPDQTASLVMKLQAEDLSKFMTGVPVKEIDLTGDLDIKGDSRILSNVVATLDGKDKVKGRLEHGGDKTAVLLSGDYRGAKNAALLAVRILGASDPSLRTQLDTHRAELASTVEAKNTNLKNSL